MWLPFLAISKTTEYKATEIYLIGSLPRTRSNTKGYPMIQTEMPGVLKFYHRWLIVLCSFGKFPDFSLEWIVRVVYREYNSPMHFRVVESFLKHSSLTPHFIMLSFLWWKNSITNTMKCQGFVNMGLYTEISPNLLWRVFYITLPYQNATYAVRITISLNSVWFTWENLNSLRKIRSANCIKPILQQVQVLWTNMNILFECFK